MLPASGALPYAGVVLAREVVSTMPTMPFALEAAMKHSGRSPRPGIGSTVASRRSGKQALAGKLALSCCCFLLWLPAIAQGQTAVSQGSGDTAPRLYSAQTASGPTSPDLSRLLGATVISADNEIVGNVNDLVLDEGGKVQAAVVGLGGFLGLGEKDVAVSPDALTFAPPADPDAPRFPNAHYGGSSLERVVLRMTVQDLAKAPAFEATSGKTSVGVPSSGSGSPESKSKPKSSTESGGPG